MADWNGKRGEPRHETFCQLIRQQLKVISLERVLQKRRFDQALNAKEFAVLVGISYSTARD